MVCSCQQFEQISKLFVKFLSCKLVEFLNKRTIRVSSGLSKIFQMNANQVPQKTEITQSIWTEHVKLCHKRWLFQALQFNFDIKLAKRLNYVFGVYSIRKVISITPTHQAKLYQKKVIFSWTCVIQLTTEEHIHSPFSRIAKQFRYICDIIWRTIV